MPSAAHLLKKILLGSGHSTIPAAERLINQVGHLDIKEVLKKHPEAMHPIWSRLFGIKPKQILKQRFAQGGLVGKGGILRGPIGLDPEFFKVQKEKGLQAAFKEVPGQVDAFFNTIPLMTAAYGVGKSIANEDYRDAGTSTTKNIGRLAAQPLGYFGKELVGATLSDLTGAGIDTVDKIRHRHRLTDNATITNI